MHCNQLTWPEDLHVLRDNTPIVGSQLIVENRRLFRLNCRTTSRTALRGTAYEHGQADVVFIKLSVHKVVDRLLEKQGTLRGVKPAVPPVAIVFEKVVRLLSTLFVVLKWHRLLPLNLVEQFLLPDECVICLMRVMELTNRPLPTPLLEFELLYANDELRLDSIYVTSKKDLLCYKIDDMAHA
jgi:hypothetical protein